MPLDVTSDQDFMSAHPDEQAAYLKSIDPEFAKAPPTEQRMYLSHVNRVAPAVSAPNLGGMIKEEEGKASTAGLPGGSPNIQPATDTMAKVAGAGIGAAGLAVGVPAAAGVAARHPILSSLAITEARRLPYVGKYIPPYAEFAPLLMGGKGGKIPPAETEAAKVPQTVEEMQSWWRGRGGTVAGDRPIARAPRPQPSVPEEGGSINIPPPTPVQAKPQLNLPRGQYEAPASPIPPQKALGEGVLEGEYMDEPTPPPPTIRGNLPRGHYAAPASPLPPPKQLGPGAPPPSSEWPPAEPAPRFKVPAPSASRNGRADLLEDQGVQQDMKNYLENQGKQVYAREPIGKSKGEMQADFNESTGKPSPPVKRTKTPGVKVSSSASKIPAGPGPTEDLTPLLQKSLEMARKKKGQ